MGAGAVCGREPRFPTGICKVIVTFLNIIKCFKIHKHASLSFSYLISVTDDRWTDPFRDKET